jgi:hypothetical protein
MLPLSLATIDEAFLRQLCESECPESQTLDFKRELPGKQDQDKHEICKDVVALANAEGGDLVYGIEEKDGVAGSIVGIITESADVAIRRINQVLDAGIEPRIHGLRIQQIPVSDGYVLILRVPSSYDGPHCIRTNSNNKQQRRFVMRNGTMVSDMSYDQIRGAFDRTATLAEQARRFIATRRELIAKDETPVPLISERPQLVVHLVPIAGLAGRMTVDLMPIYKNGMHEFTGPFWRNGFSSTFNFDGLVIHTNDMGEDGYHGYNHIFRIGALEGVTLGGGFQGSTDDKLVEASLMSKFFYNSLKCRIENLKSLSFSGPALFGLGILNVKGYKLHIEIDTLHDLYHRSSKTADRQHLVPSDVWIEDIETVDDDGLIDNVIRPLLDTLWQAFGVERCPYFDDVTGKFAPRQR